VGWKLDGNLHDGKVTWKGDLMGLVGNCIMDG
jgi:hypothetical protein